MHMTDVQFGTSAGITMAHAPAKEMLVFISLSGQELSLSFVAVPTSDPIQYVSKCKYTAIAEIKFDTL